MFKREVEKLVVGNSYLSYMMLFKNLKKGFSGILVDDDRIGYGSFYLKILGELEKEFITEWGKTENIEPLQNIKKYLKTEAIVFIVDNKRVRLGGEPYSNLLELSRKFGNFVYSDSVNNTLDEDNFNLEFYDFCNELGIYLNKNSSMKLSQIMVFCPSSIKQAFKNFKERFNSIVFQKKNFQHFDDIFYSLVKAYFHGVFSFTSKEEELFHLFLTIISPHYILDENSLNKDLEQVFLEKGGIYKKANIKEWTFDKKFPWAVELDSYEGIIRPKEVYFFAGLLNNYNFELGPLKEVYVNLNLLFKIDDTIISELVGEKIIYSNAEKLGTDTIFWVAEIYENDLKVNIFIKKEKCTKIEFVLEEVKNEFLREFYSIVNIGISETIEVEASFGKDVVLNCLYLPDQYEEKDSFIINNLAPNQRDILKRTHYLGPYNRNLIGKISPMLEIQKMSL